MDMYLLSGEQCIGTKLHEPAQITSLRIVTCFWWRAYRWVGIICMAI